MVKSLQKLGKIVDLSVLHSMAGSAFEGAPPPREEPLLRETAVAKAAIDSSAALFSQNFSTALSKEVIELRSSIPATDLALLEYISPRVMPGYSFISIILCHCLIERMLFAKGPAKIIHPLGTIAIAADRKEFRKLKADYEKEVEPVDREEGIKELGALDGFVTLISMFSELLTNVSANQEKIVKFLRALMNSFIEDVKPVPVQVCCLIKVAIFLISRGHATDLNKPISEIFGFTSRTISASIGEQRSPISFHRLIGLSKAISIAPLVAHKLFDLLLDFNDSNFDLHDAWSEISSALLSKKKGFPNVELLQSLFHDEVVKKYTPSHLIDIRKQIEKFMGSTLYADYRRYRAIVNTLYSYFDRYEEFYKLRRGLGDDYTSEALQSLIVRYRNEIFDLISYAPDAVNCIKQFSQYMMQSIRFNEVRVYLRLYMKCSPSLALVTPEMGVFEDVIQKNVLALITIKGVKEKLNPSLSDAEKKLLEHVNSAKAALRRWMVFVSDVIDPAKKTLEEDVHELKDLQKFLESGFRKIRTKTAEEIAQASLASLRDKALSFDSAEVIPEIDRFPQKLSSPDKLERTTPTSVGILELLTLTSIALEEKVKNSFHNGICYLQHTHHLIRETALHISNPKDTAFHLLDMLKSSYFALEQLLTGVVLETHKDEDSILLFERLGHSLFARFEESGIRDLLPEGEVRVSVENLIRDYDGIEILMRELPYRHRERRALVDCDSFMRSESLQEGDLKIIILHREKAKNVIKTFFLLASLLPSYFEQKNGEQERFLALLDEETFAPEFQNKSSLSKDREISIGDWASHVERIAKLRGGELMASSLYNFDAMLYQIEQLGNNPLLRFRGVQARLDLRQALEYALINALSSEKRATYDYRHDLFFLVQELGLSESQLSSEEKEFLQKSPSLRNKLRYEKIRQGTPSPEYRPEGSFSPLPFTVPLSEIGFTLVESEAVIKLKAKIIRELQIAKSVMSKIFSAKS